MVPYSDAVPFLSSTLSGALATRHAEGAPAPASGAGAGAALATGALGLDGPGALADALTGCDDAGGALGTALERQPASAIATPRTARERAERMTQS